MMMTAALLIIALVVSVCSAALPEGRVVWVEHGGWNDRHTTVNNQRVSEVPANRCILCEGLKL